MALKKTLLKDGSVAALAETFKVLGDTTRVRILDALSRSELCVCDIARLFGLSESAVSHQLRLLRGMRLVAPRRAGRLVFYTLDDQHIVGLFGQGLEHVEERAPAAMRDGSTLLSVALPPPPKAPASVDEAQEREVRSLSSLSPARHDPDPSKVEAPAGDSLEPTAPGVPPSLRFGEPRRSALGSRASGGGGSRREEGGAPRESKK